MSDTSQQLPKLITTAGLDSVRESLVRLDYTESTVAKLIGSELPPFRLRMQALPLHLRRLRLDDPLHAVIRCFLLKQPLSEHTKAMLGELASPLVEAGLLQSVGSEYRASVELVPYRGLLVASDWPTAKALVSGQEPVMGVAASTRALDLLTIRRPFDAILDLGTGCGVLAQLAAQHGRSVYGVDLNPRAVELAEFNARLNGIGNVVYRQGSLFEPVANQRFDLIVCNPPFVISPARGWMHSHGGRRLDEFCQQIILSLLE